VCVYVCMCMHINIGLLKNDQILDYLKMTKDGMCVGICVCIYVCVCIYIFDYLKMTKDGMYMYVCMCMHIHIHTYTYICI
jgi:hypothetical protein